MLPVKKEEVRRMYELACDEAEKAWTGLPFTFAEALKEHEKRQRETKGEKP